MKIQELFAVLLHQNIFLSKFLLLILKTLSFAFYLIWYFNIYLARNFDSPQHLRVYNTNIKTIYNYFFVILIFLLALLMEKIFLKKFSFENTLSVDEILIQNGAF